MSALNLSPNVSSSSSPLTNHGNLASLIEDLPSTISHLRSDRDKAISFLRQVLEAQNENALYSLIESKLIVPKDFEDHAVSSVWFLECYAGILNRSVEQKENSLFQYLSSMKRFLKQVFLEHPKRLNKVVIEQLLRFRKVPSDFNKPILENPIFQQILWEILEEAVLHTPFDRVIGKHNDIFAQSGVFSFFKATPILEKFVQNALDERKISVLRNLIDKRLLKSEVLCSTLSKDKELHVFFLEEFKGECRQKEPNKVLVLFLIDAGLKFKSAEIYPLAKSGRCSLLREIYNRGHDISEAIFQLIKENGSILNLLNEDRTKGLDPNLKNKEGDTLLIEAVEQDKHRIVEDLLRYGANPLILGGRGQNVFDISRAKSLQTRRALYRSPELRNSHLIIGSSRSWNRGKVAEEKVLEEFFKKHAQNEPFAKFFAFFIKVDGFALALLKPGNPYPKTSSCYQEVFNTHPENRIYCWSSQDTYGIPEVFAPNHLSMDTLGFVIKDFSEKDGEQSRVVIDKHRYACIRLESDYKAKNPKLDQGFKYSYGGVQTHGHGKNPEALRSAFREHREGIRLNWITIPDLSENQEELAFLGEQMHAMFEVEQEHAGQLTQLQKRVTSYVEQTESIIEARHSVASSSEKFGEEKKLVESAYDYDIKGRLKNAHIYTFNEKRLLEWQAVIHMQIQSLQELEKKLLKGNCMDVGVFKEERKDVDDHLKSIRDMVAFRSVTSSEVATLRVCMFSPLIEDVFAPNRGEIGTIKQAICRLIGTFFRKIPVSINPPLAACFLDGQFRNEVMDQLYQEAQFIVAFQPLDAAHDPVLIIKMQKLAIELSLMQDTSAIIEKVPPVSLTSDEEGSLDTDAVLESTMSKHLKSYASARELLGELWLKVCQDRDVLRENMDKMLRLFMRRLLLMDEEVRDVVNGNLYYPSLETRSPRRMLDEQVFLLTSSLVVALSYQQDRQKNPSWFQHVIDYLHLRLTPSFHGVEKKRYKLDGLFLPLLIDEILKIKDIVDVAWESDKSENSPFQALGALLEDYYPPKQEELKGELTKAFRSLSADEPYLQLNPSIETLVSKVRAIRSELKRHGDANDQDRRSVSTKEAQAHLEKSLKVFDYLRFGADPFGRTVQKKRESIDHQSVSESEKDQLKESLIQRLKRDIRSGAQVLLRKAKRNSDVAQLTIDKVKAFQRGCGSLLRDIDEYLGAEKPVPPLEIAELRAKSLEILSKIKGASQGSLEKSINKFSIVHDSLNKESLGEIDVVLGVQNLSEQLESFFKGDKGKKVAGRYGTLPQELSALVKPHIESILPAVLRELQASLEDLQKGIYSMYFKRLEKKQARLCLGIREQTYYTIDQTNASYYLWDGKKFDDLPLDKDDASHLPLEEDFALSQSRQEQFCRDSFKAPDLEDQEELHVTSIRNFGRQPNRRNLL